MTLLFAARHHDSSRCDWFRPGENVALLTIEWNHESALRLSLLRPGGGVAFSMPVDGSLLPEVRAAEVDLNRDGTPDYVVVTQSGGCGLAGQITFATFLLSSPRGYVGRSVFSFDAAPTDLVDLDADGRPEFVHGMLVWGDVGRDGRAHNYWVYNLLEFHGTTLTSANRVDRKFPKWVMYGYQPNHTETRQLTGAQRERQWRAAWADEKDRFPAVVSLASFAAQQRGNRP